jgi:uncharacterized membrane protein
MSYLVVKWLHILSAAILFGTGLGIAFFKWQADKQDAQAQAAVMRTVVLADWMFTAPAVVIQLVTGVALALMAGYPLKHGWVLWALLLYVLAGACWLPVLWLQWRMRDLAGAAAASSAGLPPQYARYRRLWVWLGVPAFSAVIAIYYLMVFKPY